MKFPKMPPSTVFGQGYQPLNEFDMREWLEPRRLTTVMWDHAFLTRHVPGDSFEDYDRVLDEAVERGYNTLRLDPLPQVIDLSKPEIVYTQPSFNMPWLPWTNPDGFEGPAGAWLIECEEGDMNELERFKAVVRFEKPDYWPLVTTGGLGYVHAGGLVKLHAEGLPAEVNDIEAWCRYWGQCTFDHVPGIGEGAPGVKSETWQEDGFEYVRSELGGLTRQVIDNNTTYSMPDFIEFEVRDRASWEKYKELTTPTRAATEKIPEIVERFKDRTRPAVIGAGGTWGIVRSQMGPQRALLAVYDDPDLVRDMIDHMLWSHEQFIFPVIEAIRPEIIGVWEDFAYNHGMLISPDAFREFCAPYYQRVAELGRDCAAELMIVDCDGKVDEFCLLLEEVGFNGCWPMEQVCGNPLLEYRKRQPKFVFAGGIEKEIVNTGNGGLIEAELAKVPPLLEAGGYFPMFDHAIQTEAGFDEMCQCFTRLHEICDSPGDVGEFPRQ